MDSNNRAETSDTAPREPAPASGSVARDWWARFVDWTTRPTEAPDERRWPVVRVSGPRARAASLVAGLLSLVMITGSVAAALLATSPTGPVASADRPQAPTAQQLADGIGTRADQLGRGDPLTVLQLRLAAYTVDKTSARHRAALAQLLLGARPLAVVNATVGDVTSLAFDSPDRLAVGGRDGIQEASGRSTALAPGKPLPGDVTDVSALVYQSGQLWAATGSGIRSGTTAAGASTELAYALVRVGPTGWAATTRDGRLLTWDTSPAAGPAGRTLTTGLGSGAPLAATPDGRYLFAPGAGGVTVWDATTGQVAATIPASGGSRALSVDATGRRLLLVHGGQASVVDTTNPTVPTVGPALANSDGPVNAAVLAPDGKTAVTASERSTTVWQLTDPAGPTVIATLPVRGGARALAYSSDSSVLATATGTTVRTWSVAELLVYQPARVQATVKLQSHPKIEPIMYAAMNSDASFIITSGDPAKPAYVWQTHTLIRNDPDLQYHSALDAPIRQASAVGGLAKTTMITVDRAGQSTLWEVSSATTRNRGRIATGITAAAITPDEKYAITFAGPEATVWGLALDRQAEGTLTYPSPTTTVALAANGTAIVGGHADGSVTVHTVDLNRKHADRRHLDSDTHNPVDAVALADNSAVALAAHDNGGLTVWDLTRPDPNRGITISDAVNPGPHQAWLSSTGDFAVISDSQGTTSLWSLTDRAAPMMLATVLSNEATLPVTVSADAHTALQVQADNGIVLWNLQPVLGLVDDPTSRACHVAGLTHQRWRELVPEPNLNAPCLPPPVPALDATTTPRPSFTSSGR